MSPPAGAEAPPSPPPAAPSGPLWAQRDRAWRRAAVLLALGVVLAFAGTIRELVTLWATKVDYSHGFLIVPFAAYLVWAYRDKLPAKVRWPNLSALAVIGAAVALSVGADRTNFAREWLRGLALILALGGAFVFLFGWRGTLRAALPGLAFLVFALPLPYRAEFALGQGLQRAATAGGNFAFQTLGLASSAEGNVIVIGETRLEVDRACGGLSMLLAFLALAAGAALLMRHRPLIDRALVLAMAVPIALGCNLLRIVVTGLVYHAGWRQLGDLVIHDLAGWLMMPLALGLVVLGLRLIDWVAVPTEAIETGDALGLPRRSPDALSAALGTGPFRKGPA